MATARSIRARELPERRPQLPTRVCTAFILSVLVILCGCLSGCGRPPDDSSSHAISTQILPFDRHPRGKGISPSRNWLPSDTKLPEGTTIAVRLKNRLSSATSHPGDGFTAVLDEPVMVDGRTLLAAGTEAKGRILEAKYAASSSEPGYIRMVLESVDVDGRHIMIETSSIFAKAGPREENQASSSGVSSGREDIVFDAGRRLNFRLAQTVDMDSNLGIPANL
jgi:hypothetical protein